MIKGKTFIDLKESYTGGSTDMYVPHGVNIHGYDINSLYPHSMANNPMPVNNIKYFEGNIDLNQYFGFFYVEVEAPDNLNIPVLQIHHNNKTVSPLGKFTGWFFSPELINAINLFGYKIKIIKGYSFDKANIFKGYVNELYQMRLTYPKSNPMNYIAKILMNSLYGRFGLNPLLPETQFIAKDMLEDFISTCEITDLIEFDDKILIQYIDQVNLENFDNDSEPGVISNIAIASAITGYSRITMSLIKKYCLDHGIIILYSDTDSVFTDKPLPDYLVGNKLGQWKLEGLYKEAVFIAPKVYALIEINGKEIVKCKGYKNKDLTFNDLKNLLTLNESIKLPQQKWYKSIEESKITIKNQLYTLQATGNKRLLMYNKDKFLIQFLNKNKIDNFPSFN